MRFKEKTKYWFSKNKKYLLVGGCIALIVIGTGVSYVLWKNKKLSFDSWLKNASNEELKEAYETLRLDFCTTGVKTYPMKEIGNELYKRSTAEWFAKHPPNINSNFRWTDEARWDKD